MDARKTAVIIGAGPAGLTAAYELVHRTDIKPLVLEAEDEIGGICRTVEFNGNRIDIGGHRFFSKSDRVMEWWKGILPLQRMDHEELPELTGLEANSENAPDPEKTDRVMLVRSRLSRIYFLRKLFDYPVCLNLNTLSNLGLKRIARIALSYFCCRINQIGDIKNLEDFFVSRFGKELYLTFFKNYTEKVWGVPCSEIKPEWGIQRVKGLSVGKAVLDALMNVVHKESSVAQKRTETSLIRQFMYPKGSIPFLVEILHDHSHIRRPSHFLSNQYLCSVLS